MAHFYAFFFLSLALYQSSLPVDSSIFFFFSGEFVSLENDANENLKINLSSIIQHASALSYVARPSKRSACFTKSYSLFLKGCGSVFVTTPELQVLHCHWNTNLKCSHEFATFDPFIQVEHPKEELLKLLVLFVSDSKQTSLSEPFGLRFFSWREVANLLGFPSDFHKPERITDKQMYRALGNSVSIFAVAALLKYLLECKGPYRWFWWRLYFCFQNALLFTCFSQHNHLRLGKAGK